MTGVEMKTIAIIANFMILMLTLSGCTDNDVRSLQQVINASNSNKVSTSIFNKTVNIDANKERV